MNKFLYHFEKILPFLSSLRSETVKLGDFNIDTLKDDNYKDRKKQASFYALGQSPSATKRYATVKSKKQQNEMSKLSPDEEAVNEYFAKIGSILAAEIESIHNKIRINRVKDTMVTTPTNSQEVAKVLKHLQTKKVVVMMESQMKFYQRKCLLMFYNSFAKSIICYGLLVYGSAAKTNLQKIECAQR